MRSAIVIAALAAAATTAAQAQERIKLGWIAGVEHIRPRCLALALIPAQDRAHARQQLTHAEGLDHH